MYKTEALQYSKRTLHLISDSTTKKDISNFNIFGCKAFVHIPDTKRKDRLDKKSIPCIFVGYPTTENGFKLFNLETRQMLRSCDVILAENKFETYITGCPKKGCELFTDNIQFHTYDSEDTELTHEDATIPVHEEAALLLKNRKAPSRLDALTGDWWDIVENASNPITDADEPKVIHETLNESKSKQWSEATRIEFKSM